MSKPIDLKARFGKRFFVKRDPAYFAEYGPNAFRPDPWYWQIRCRHGHLYAQSSTEIGWASLRRGQTVKRVAALPGARVVQDGDDGANVAVPQDQAEALFAIVRPHRRPRISPERRAALVAQLKSIDSPLSDRP